MTELMKCLLADGREQTQKKIEEMSSGCLLAELDDTLQFDLMKMDNVAWAENRDKAVYLMLVNELSKRLPG